MSHEDELQSVLERVSQREEPARRRAIIYTVIPILVGALLIWVTWQQVSTATHKLNETEAQLVESDQRLADSKQKVDALQKQLNQADLDLKTLNAQVSQLRKDAKTLQIEVEKNKADIKDLQAQRDNLKEQVEFLTSQVEESKVLNNKLYQGDTLVVLKEMYDYPLQSQLLEEILFEQSASSWRAGGIGPDEFDSPGFAVYMLSKFGLVNGNPEDIHYSLINILPPTEAPQIGDVVFYEGGYTMFYFEDPSTQENFVIGMTTFGVIALKYDFAPRKGIRHVEYP